MKLDEPREMPGRRIIRATAILATLTVLLIGIPGSVSAEPTAAEVEHAKRFRAAAGFPAGEAFVRENFARSDYTQADWGIPLSASERDELFARVRRSDDAMPGIEAASKVTGYAGVYLDNKRGGKPIFLASKNRSKIKSEVERAIKGKTTFEVKNVARSLARLTVIKEEVHDLASELDGAGIVLTSVGYDIPNNRVSVGVDGSVEKARDLLADLGDAVVVKLRRPGIVDACSITSCAPAKGGLKVAGNASYCTAGFMAKVTTGGNHLVLLTAGHCWQFAQASNSTWKHNGVVIGDSDFRVWDSGSGGTYPRIPTDAGAIDIRSGFVPGSKNKLLTKKSGGVGNVKSWAPSLLNHPPGTYVCRIGAGSAAPQAPSGYPAKKCGTVTTWAVDNLSCKSGTTAPCAMVSLTMEVSFDSTGGDSGGAIWKGPYSATSPYKAMGMHVHSKKDSNSNPFGWYTPIGEVIDAFKEKKNKDVHLCLNTNC